MARQGNDEQQRSAEQAAAEQAEGTAGEARTGDAGGGADELTQVEQTLREVQSELEAAQERALRSQAELENVRRRMRREMDEQQRYATLPLIHDLLAVLDNLQRALEASEADQTAGGLVEGVRMVAQQLQSVLERHHCREIPAVGLPFDPHRHEAVGQEPSSTVPAGSVARVLRTGYQLHDRVIRPTQVYVAIAPAEPGTP